MMLQDWHPKIIEGAFDGSFALNPIELIALAGYLLAFAGFCSRRDDKTKGFIAVAMVLNAIYFGLHGMMITAAITLLSSARVTLSIWHQNKSIGYTMITLTLAVGLLTESTDYLGLIVGVTGTVAVFWFSGISMRGLMMVCSVLMLINAAWHQAPMAIAGEILMITANIAGIQRILRDRSFTKKAFETRYQLPNENWDQAVVRIAKKLQAQN